MQTRITDINNQGISAKNQGISKKTMSNKKYFTVQFLGTLKKTKYAVISFFKYWV